MIELVTYLTILAREVQGIEMSREEMEMDFQGAHPTGNSSRAAPHNKCAIFGLQYLEQLRIVQFISKVSICFKVSPSM